MKELSIEEKARRYDEAKYIMKEYLESGNAGVIAENTIKKAFPELKDKDERIREYLITYFSDIDDCASSLKGKDVVAWLEKQGEQKATIIIPKFRVGDEIKTSNEESLTITKIDEKGYWSEDLFICGFDDAAKWELVEQKSSWSEEDDKKAERIIRLLQEAYDINCINGSINWLKSLKDRVQPKQEILEKLEEWLDEYVSDLADVDTASLICSFTNYLDGKLPKSIRPQTKQEWSEEDEKEVAVLEAYIRSKDWSERHIDRALGIVDELVNKVKSLRPQVTWKPSDEQMEILQYVCETSYHPNEKVIPTLESLYNDLKELREK